MNTLAIISKPPYDSTTSSRGTSMGKSRRKPIDPAEIARQKAERAERERRARHNPAEWGTNDAAMTLPANGSVRSEAETRTKTRRVRRWDGFAILLSHGSLTAPQEAAVRRLEELVAVRYRVDRARASDERVDRSAVSPTPITDASMSALRDIEDIGHGTGQHSMGLLLAILEPQVRTGQVINWRAAVKDFAGEPFPHGQVALVRAACENLRLAWVEWDNRPRRAA